MEPLIAEITKDIRAYTGATHVTAVQAVADPHVEGCYAVRCRVDWASSPESVVLEFLWHQLPTASERVAALEEVEFAHWPPRTR
jgi:hypothetical protein